jgi:cytochrome c oxidase subunit 2
VIFTLLALAAIAWSASLVLSSFLPRYFTRRPLWILGAIVLLLGAISTVSDYRTMALRRRAPDSGVSIAVHDMGRWLQLGYVRGKTSFITANELHVPAGAIVAIDWQGPVLAGWSAHDFFPLNNGRWSFIARDSGIDEAWLIRLWPAPGCRRLVIVSDSPPEFERWFANEAKPARASAPSFFASCGCAYCHVIRGVAERPWKLAPDLTHFASRRTIAETSLPNRRGFLAGWVIDSASLEPGSEMPRNRLAPAVLHKMLGYLESLR